MQRYRLGRMLGRGGSAEVYEAILQGDGGFERRVAVKRLVDTHPDRDALQAFQDEAKVAARLDHPNIVRVLDFGLMNGAPFIVMDYNDGENLRELFNPTQRIPTGAALFIAAEVARGLAHAHRAKDDAGRRLELVHRDVSPDNILVSWSGQVRLADFGIASFVDRSSKTRTGMIKGKLSYIAPERWAGDVFDHRADLFALGCVLFTLLAGTRPNAEDTARGISDEAWAWIRSQPDDLRVILERCLARDPQARYAEADTLALACERAAIARANPSPRGELELWLRARQEEREPARSPLLEWFELEHSAEDSEREGLPVYRTRVVERPRDPLDPGFEAFTASTLSATLPRLEPRGTATQTVLVSSRKRPPREPLVLAGALLLLALSFAALNRPPRSPEPSRDERAPLAPIAPPVAVVAAVEPSTAAVPIDASQDVGQQPTTVRGPRLVRPHSSPEARGEDKRLEEIDDLLARARLEPADLDAPAREALEMVRRTKKAPREGWAEEVLASIERHRFDLPVLMRRLDRLKTRMREGSAAIPLDRLSPIEEQYLDLRTQARSASPDSARELGRDISRLERRLDEIERASGASENK